MQREKTNYLIILYSLHVWVTEKKNRENQKKKKNFHQYERQPMGQ